MKEEKQIKKDMLKAIIVFIVLAITYIISLIVIEFIIPNEYMYIIDSIFPYITLAYFIVGILGLFVISCLVYLLFKKPWLKNPEVVT